jgi:predicted RecB family nuclease
VPLPNLLREEHIRRLSMVLQRHGLNPLLSHQLRPGPVTADIANSTPLRREVEPSTDLAGISRETRRARLQSRASCAVVDRLRDSNRRGPRRREVTNPVLLDGYAAKHCPVRVHNDFAPLVPKLAWKPSPEDQLRLDAGIAFEAAVFARLRELQQDCVLIDVDLRGRAAVAATTAAMDGGARLILGGWLPDDTAGGRKGRPDLLIRVGGGYVPGDVKGHKTIEPAKTKAALMSTLMLPAQRRPVHGWTSATSHRFDDGMQLAHYSRMLQACGRHPGEEFLVGAIIGTSQLSLAAGAPVEWVLTWHDLTEPVVSTYSRSRGKAKRSLLERYDHEHAFRVKVAHRALEIIGAPADPAPLVTPIGQPECDSCPYQAPCATVLENDPSAAITIGRLDVREWLTLRSLGITSTMELAELDLNDATFFASYTAEVTQHSPDTARKRLAMAKRRAVMICDGIELWPNDDTHAEVPAADIEIDLDIESDQNNSVYMWGIRLRRGNDDATGIYVPDFTVWDPMNKESEYALAQRFADWLRQQCTAATADGKSLRVFHWSSPEWSNLRRILGVDAVRDLIGDRDSTDQAGKSDGVFTDLEVVFKKRFTSLHGTGIKVVAPLFDFHWRVTDPGGGVSLTYLSTVQTSDDEAEVNAAKEWLFSYNEDDNRAMAAIRDGMRKWTATTA